MDDLLPDDADELKNMVRRDGGALEGVCVLNFICKQLVGSRATIPQMPEMRHI